MNRGMRKSRLGERTGDWVESDWVEETGWKETGGKRLSGKRVDGSDWVERDWWKETESVETGAEREESITISDRKIRVRKRLGHPFCEVYSECFYEATSNKQMICYYLLSI